jgi:hypothetical protein
MARITFDVSGPTGVSDFQRGNGALRWRLISATSCTVRFPIPPYDAAAAAWHGEERPRLEAQGRPAPFVDGQIAAIAHVHGLALATINDRDFRSLQGIDRQELIGKARALENWVDVTLQRRF